MKAMRLVWLGVLLAMGGSRDAQSGPSMTFARVNKPLRSATLDFATGTVTRGARVRDRGASTVADFYNLDLSGFVGVDTGGGFCEWFDAGVKGFSGNTSDWMASITFAYCSSKLSPSSGGPGGSVKLGFYEGYVAGGGTPTTAVAIITLTGLPGNTTSSSFFGNARCYLLTVDFSSSMIPFADGPIGYSWRFLDNGTGTINPMGATLAGTWPMLACVTSCSGFGPDGQGMVNSMDQYCPPGILRSSFSLRQAGPFPSYTSLGLEIYEAVSFTSTISACNSATNPNPDLIITDEAIIGAPFTADLLLGLPRSSNGTWLLFFGTSKISPPNGVPIANIQGGLNFGNSKSGRMLLVNINTSGFSCMGTYNHITTFGFSNCGGQDIPPSIGLVGEPWYAQGVVIGAVAPGGLGNARLTSAIQGIIGTE